MVKKQKDLRILPHSNEGEQSVLGCVLIDKDASFNVLGELKDSDFYVEAHRIIFTSMFELYTNNKPTDFITVVDDLTKKDMLDSVGGIEYITMLTNVVPSASNFQHYIDIVKRDSVLRQLISASQEIINNSYEGLDKEEALSLAEKNIFEIGDRDERGGLTHIDTALKNTIENLEEIQKEGGKIKGVPSGIYGIDRITNGFQNGALILIAARPGCGKTSLGMNIINYAATVANKKCAIFSLEMSKEEIALRSLCSLGYVDSKKANKGELSLNDWKALMTANDKLKKSNIYIDEGFSKTPIDILSKCRKLKREKGLDVIMIDYLQLMQVNKRTDNRQQEISEITRTLKMAARELNVPIILLSQLSRNTEGRKDHRPILSDLRESGAIEQDADMVIFIYRSDMYNDVSENEKKTDVAELIIAKNRSGPLDTVKVKWVGSITTFLNFEKDASAMSLENNEPKADKIKNKEDDREENVLIQGEPVDDLDVDDVF